MVPQRGLYKHKISLMRGTEKKIEKSLSFLLESTRKKGGHLKR